MIRLILVALFSLAQTATLPPPYPRPGTTKLLENNRVIVWNITWLKQQYPLHRHLYDLMGVYYSDGDRTIISENGDRRPVHTKAWDTIFQQRGVTHIEEGASDVPLHAVFAELKEPAPTGAVDTASTPAAFPTGGVKPNRESARGILWEFVPPPPPGSHRHLRDAVAVAFTGDNPTVSWVPRGTVHTAESAAGADRVYVIELK